MAVARALALVSALAWLLAAPLPAAALDASQCLAGKYQALGKYLKRQTACSAKAAKKGLLADPACQQKAEAKLANAFAKAEARGDCVLTADVVPLQGLADASLGRYATALEARLACCDLGPGLCAATTDADCAAYGGALGLAGTTCDGATGSCVALPASGGCCRDPVDSGFRFSCVGGSGANALACSAAAGEYAADAVCLNSGLCAEP